MIIGNPYKFAIIIQRIDEWNTTNLNDTFCNGVLLLCINGELFPKSLDTATLSTEQIFWRKQLENIVVNHELYQLPTYELFVSIYNLVFPTDLDIDNDYRFDFSPQTLCPTNSGCHIFVVSNGENIRILASELKYNIEESVHKLIDISITETVIMIDEFHNFFSQAIDYINEL